MEKFDVKIQVKDKDNKVHVICLVVLSDDALSVSQSLGWAMLQKLCSFSVVLHKEES